MIETVLVFGIRISLVLMFLSLTVFCMILSALTLIDFWKEMKERGRHD